MLFVVRRATLLIPSGAAQDPNRKHLFICISDPVGKARNTLLTSVGTIYPAEPFDPTCRLYPGDHPFIQHDSYVNYYFSRITPAEKLEKGVQQGLLVPKEILDSAVFARVCKGFTDSRFVAKNILEFYEKLQNK